MSRADQFPANDAELQGHADNVIRFPEQLVENLRRRRSTWRPEKAQRFRFPRGPSIWSSAEEWRRFTLGQWLSRRAMAGIDWDTAVVCNDSTDDIPNRQPGDPFYAKRDRSKNGKRVKIVMGTGIAMRPISWLWQDWLAHGKLHIFAGRPGCLKTTTAIGFAAGVTVGGYWPDGSRIAQGNVVIWSGEDAIEDTLMPRFIAAGGDPNHIAFIKGVEEDGKARAFDPSSDIKALAEVCAQLGNVNLIIIDPVVMIAKGDSHKNAEARKDLQPLVDLAEQTQAAVIGIHHLTKRSEGANPVDRVSGSLAFGAAPRVILLNALDPKGGAEPRGVLMRAKSNIGPAHGGYSFTAEQNRLDDEPGISAQRILWGEFVDRSAGDILEEYEGKVKAAAEKRRKIAEFLTEALANGPRMAAEVEAEGEKLDFSPWALRRAFKKLGGHPQKPSFKSGWVWELPELSP